MLNLVATRNDNEVLGFKKLVSHNFIGVSAPFYFAKKINGTFHWLKNMLLK